MKPWDTATSARACFAAWWSSMPACSGVRLEDGASVEGIEDDLPVSGIVCGILDWCCELCLGEAELFLLLSLAADDVRGDTRPCCEKVSRALAILKVS